MVICCYSSIENQWSGQDLSDKLALLPGKLQDEAMRKRLWVDRQLSISGKLLLKEVLHQFGMEQVSLSDLKYNSYHRPYFDTRFDFNIAHSGNIVICCGTDNGKVGIDIEKINPIELSDYTDYFTPNEWGIIRNYPNQFDGFYDFWTRKEAVLKAIGTGFHTPLSSVDVANNTIAYDGISYHIQKLDVVKGYQCHMATSEKTGNVKLLSVNI